MRYFFDTEFIEDGRTIDLISIGIVSEDGRELYAQRDTAAFGKANDWLWRNVYPSLVHFDYRRAGRSCDNPKSNDTLKEFYGGKCHKRDECAWVSNIPALVKGFVDPETYGKPEFWAYYADYDWVVLCQLFGTMLDLPKGWPMYCRDIKQLCDALGNPTLPKKSKDEHHALADAKWNLEAYKYLQG